MRKMTMLLTGSPVYFNEQITQKRQKRSLPRKSINSREYFNENLDQRSTKNRNKSSFFSCCNGESEKYENKGFGLRPEVRPKVKNLDESYMDISKSILDEQRKMYKKKEKTIKYTRDSEEDRSRVIQAQDESEKIKASFVMSAEMEEKDRANKRMLREALERREQELNYEMESKLKRERDEKGELYIKLA